MPTNQEEPKTLCQRGEAVYETKLRATLDTPENRGKVLSIEPDSEDYEINADHYQAVMRLRERHPDKISFSMRIGFPALGYLRGGRVIKK